jgi:hypothetical protein
MLRLESRGLGDAAAQALADALGGNVTSRVTKPTKQIVTPSVTKLRDIHQAWTQAVAELPKKYKLPVWEALPLELREVIIGVYHLAKRDGAAGRQNGQ